LAALNGHIEQEGVSMKGLPRKIFTKKSNRIVGMALGVLMVGFSMVLVPHAFALRPSASLTEITGRIRDIHGKPVAALKISLMNWFGADLGNAVSDDQGAFHIRNVVPGSYYVKFRPLGENSRGETMVIQVPSHPMRMNLTVTRNPPAIARAERPITMTG
jgi:hypothetical protein